MRSTEFYTVNSLLQLNFCVRKKQGLFLFLRCITVALTSTPRPWIDVFALPEKSNMAVTESDPDPRSGKCS